MKLTPGIKGLLTEIIALLYVLLFVYAAIIKVLDFENFRVQLGQSPLLSAFAGQVAIAVPAIELLISAGLLLRPARTVSLYAAFGLMAMFSAYIFILLHFSSFVPCSCGGILDKLSWTQHLIFNIGFALLAVAGILWNRNSADSGQAVQSPLGTYAAIGALALASAGVVAFLFLLSEDATHHRNSFVRRFPAHSLTATHRYDLKVPTYYFAGAGDGVLYLGSETAPLELRILDTALQRVQRVRIAIDQMDLPFRAVKVRVAAPHFFVADGTIPALFRGNVRDWKAKRTDSGLQHFSQIEAADTESFALYGIPAQTQQHTLGLYTRNGTAPTQWHTGLLQKQTDGLFETDGLLIRNSGTAQLHFIYYYRNQFLTLDGRLMPVARGRTIDTVSHAVLKVASLENGTVKKMQAPPLVINAGAAAYGNLLFVQSPRIGRYEDGEVWGQADIIDVYNWSDGSYCYSFRLYHIDHQKLRGFMIRDGLLYALNGQWISVVPLNEALLAKYNVKK